MLSTPAAMQLPSTRRGRALLVFLLTVTCYGYFFPLLNNWAANSRMDLIYALVDDGQVSIDNYHQNTGDKSHFHGRYYTDKSVGPSFAGVPFYVLFKWIVRLPPLARVADGKAGLGALPSLDEVYKRYHLPAPGTPGAGHPPIYHAMALSFVTFFSVAVVSALLVAVFCLMVDRFSTRPGNDVALALALGLASPAFAYSNQLYQHQAGAFGAFVGLFLLWRVAEEGASSHWLWVVGVLFGFAAASEYVLAPLLIIIVVWAGIRLQPRRDLLRIAAGAAPWVVATVAYDLAAFETPLPAGYLYSAWAGMFRTGILGFSMPSFATFYEITLSPSRGLFRLSPFLLLAPAGLWMMVRGGTRTRNLALIIGVLSVAFFVYNASYWESTAGDAVGPRYLVPTLPFLALPIVFVLNRATAGWQRAAIAVLMLVSIAGIWTLSLTGQSYPRELMGQPIFEHALPLIRAGEWRFNVGTVLGLRGIVVFVPLVGVLAIIAALVPRLEHWWVERAKTRLAKVP